MRRAAALLVAGVLVAAPAAATAGAGNDGPDAAAAAAAAADPQKPPRTRPQKAAADHFAADVPRVTDAEWEWPVGGFGGVARRAPLTHLPVVFVHGNNVDAGDWYPVRDAFRAAGWSDQELWALSYNGLGGSNGRALFTPNPQADEERRRMGKDAVTYVTENEVNVPDLAAFLDVVRDYTGSKRFLLVGHSLGVTLARETLRQRPDLRRDLVAFVGIAGANQGTSFCPPGTEWRVVSCDEIAAGTPWLERLDRELPAAAPGRWLTVYDGSGVADPAFAGPTYAQSPRLVGADNRQFPGTYHNDLRLDPAIVATYRAFLEEASAEALAADRSPGEQVAAAGAVRDGYERSLGTPARELVPPALLGHAWRGTGTTVAGDAVVSRGELVLEDRPFDDTGADTRPGNGPVVQTAVETGTLSGLCGPGSAFSTGDLAYPAGDRYGPRNAADLVQVRLAVEGDRVHVLWQLQTMVDPSVVAVALLVDADGDGATGQAEGFAGFEHALVATSDGARLDGAVVESAFDAAANTVQAAFPRSALPGAAWAVNAVAALRAEHGLGPLADAAHVPDEPVLQAPACKLDAVQSAALAGRALPSAVVDPARLARGDSDADEVRRGGFTRYYVPEHALGEGVVPQPRYGQTSSAGIYRGTVQPYSVYVPDSYDPDAPSPVILLLHCLTCWHTVYDQAAFPGLARLAESRGAIIVTPFGHGEGGHYEGEAELDAFAVLSDVSRRYTVDQERLYLSGMSMGALGTYRLGLLHPDLWARLLPVASYTTPYCVTPAPQTVDCGVPFNYLTVFPNARNVPVGLVQGTLDALTPVTANRHFADVLTDLGYRFRYWEWPTRTHDPALHGLTTDVTDPFLGDGRRERSPAHVTYVLDRVMAGENGLPDRAYWVRDLRLAADERFGRVEAASGRGSAYGVRPVSDSGQDEAGPWTMRGLDGVPGEVTGRNELRLTLRGVEAVRVDLAQAGLTREEDLTVTADVDRPVILTLDGAVLLLPAGASERVLPASAAAPS